MESVRNQTENQVLSGGLGHLHRRFTGLPKSDLIDAVDAGDVLDAVEGFEDDDEMIVLHGDFLSAGDPAVDLSKRLHRGDVSECCGDRAETEDDPRHVRILSALVTSGAGGRLDFVEVDVPTAHGAGGFYVVILATVHDDVLVCISPQMTHGFAITLSAGELHGDE